MIRSRGFGGILAVVVAAIAACGSAQPSSSPTPNATVIARVGSQTITQAQFDVRLTSVTAGIAQAGGPTSGSAQTAMLSTVRAKIMQGLITDTVIAQEAATLGLAATDTQVNAEIALDQQSQGGADQLATQLASVGGSLDQLRDETRARINDEHVEDYFAQQRAAQVEAQLAQGAPFASLAKQFSDDAQTAPSGGDVGVMTSVALSAGDPAFKTAVLALHAGQTTSSPVRDSMGYEILRVTAITAQGPHVLRILVGAPQPFTITGHPDWYNASVLLQLSTLCGEHQVVVYIDADNQPCTATAPVTPTAAPPTP